MQKILQFQGTLKQKPFEIKIEINGDLTNAAAMFALARSIRNLQDVNSIQKPKLTKIKPIEPFGSPFTTYRYYTKKGERLAIFALPEHGRIKSIYVLRCSTHDQFHKKIARDAFKSFIQNNKKHKDYHFQEIPVDMEANYINFLTFCRKNYYLRVPQVAPIFSLIKI